MKQFEVGRTYWYPDGKCKKYIKIDQRGVNFVVLESGEVLKLTVIKFPSAEDMEVAAVSPTRGVPACNLV